MPEAAWTLYNVMPADNTFRDAGDAVHKAAWDYAAKIGIDRFHWRCNQGLDNKGKPLTPIAESTRRRGRNRSYTRLGNGGNPPLVPALGLSRFEALLVGMGFADHAEWHWAVDPVTGLDWGQVASWHAEGGGGRYPKRNVIGWSQDDIGWFRWVMGQWEYARRHGQKVAEAMATLEVTRDKFPRVVAPAPGHGFFKVRKGERIDVEHSVGSIGTAEMSARAIAEGNATGFRVTPGGRSSRGGGRAAPPRPAPTVPLKPKAAPVPKVRRPAAVAQPAAKAPLVNPLAHERTVPRPAPAATVAAGGPAPDLATFAARAKAAAASVQGAGRFHGGKILISHAHEAYVRAHGPIRLEDYKTQLGLALQARHVDLSRADMIEAMDAFDAARSITYHPMGASWEFHFLRTE
jgi:hypothetical protein